MTKFSWDKELQCMWPADSEKLKPRNEAGWRGFWLTDKELDGLVEEIFEDYAAQAEQQSLS